MAAKSNIIISGYHVTELLWHRPGALRISLDLGVSASEVIKSDTRISFRDGRSIDLQLIQNASKKRHKEDCFLVDDGSLTFIYAFEDSKVYKLYEPHIDWPPTIFINGSMMHTVSVSKPTDEAENKVKALGEIAGDIFDTCFGLGYSAIKLVESGASSVYSCEVSNCAIKIAKLNPWSKEAFLNKKITLENTDAKIAAANSKDERFDYILHDPPNVNMAGDLYSLKFYKELYRILKPGGKIYHFVGGGKVPHEYKVDYTKGVARRLAEAKFKRISKSYRGLVASK